jgi:cytochrome c peroxidase
MGDTGEPQTVTMEFSAADIGVLRTMWPLPDVTADPTNMYAEDPWAIQLGQYLFFDEGLSSSGDVSCASCHDPSQGWSDGLKLSEGISQVDRHSMPLFNTASNRWFFWDGRCDTQWCQALQPIEDSTEMGSNRLAMGHYLANDESLSEAYRETFGELPDMSSWPSDGRPVLGEPEHPDTVAWMSMNPEAQNEANLLFTNVGKAIAAFERKIVSRDSAYDRFAEALLVDGETNEDHMSASAIRGLQLFIGDAKCHFCHAGPNFTNREFANIGLGERAWLPSGDQGRLTGIMSLLENPFRGDGPYSDAAESGIEKLAYLTTSGEQQGQFKVPSLRSVALTAPFMHGGHFDTLEQVVRHYSEVNEYPEFGHREDLLLDLSINDQQIADVGAFLEALTGAPLPDELRSQPESPLFTP